MLSEIGSMVWSGVRSELGQRLGVIKIIHSQLPSPVDSPVFL
jgi:hypothetical protein